MGFVLYRSSAGSGKTYTLVKEYLKIVLKNPERFKNILAVTFTNKAAGEMKDRIIQALRNLAGAKDPGFENQLKKEMGEVDNLRERSSEILIHILHNYSDFAIMTIDSFIHKVIKAFALEIGLPLNFGIDLNYEKLETHVLERLLASVGIDRFITKVILEFVFSRLVEEKSWNIEGDIRRFEREILKEKNIDWVRGIAALDQVDFDQLMNQLISFCSQYVKKLNHLGSQALNLIREAELTVADFAYKDRGAAGFLQKCVELREGGIKKLSLGNRFREGQWYSNSTPAEIKAAIENLLKKGLGEITEEIISYFDHNHKGALTAAFIKDNIYLTAVINRIRMLIDGYKKKNNMIPIAELNVKVYEIVKNSPIPFIYSIIGEKYNHYLIDEFQDTSTLQWENLFPLIANALGYDFFNMAVGDGKQSIYRWRGSDWEIMQKDILERIPGQQLTIKTLDNNFRSRGNIVEFNNLFFEKLRDFYKKENENVDLGQIYSEIAQEPVKKQGGFVSLQFIEPAGPEGDTDEVVFMRVNQIINDCRARGYDYGDMAILVRENKEGQRLADNLLRNRVPVVSPDSLILAKNSLVRFFIDVLSYLNNPADRIAESSIIYYLALHRKQNPLAPFTIGSYFLEGREWDITPETREFFSRREYLIHMPVYEVVEEVSRIFHLQESLDFRTSGYLQAFLDIVAGFTAENSVDISSFLDWWEFNKEEFAMIVPETKPAVRIMSIHKAKGLEFPVVIVPYANWGHNIDKQLWLTPAPPLPTEPPLDIPMPVNTSKVLEETYFRGGYQKEKEKVLIDNINLLYVAFTRARDNLYIITQPKRRNENDELLKGLARPLMQVDQQLEGAFVFGEPTRKEEKIEKPEDIEYQETDRLISNKWYEKISIRRKAKEFWRFDTDRRAEQRSRGLLVHQLLAKIRTFSDAASALDAALFSGDMAAEERGILEEKIAEILANDRAREWFNPEQQVFIESPIITDEGLLRPDRLIISEGRVVIIEFKTGGKDSSHVNQMLRYRHAVQAMGYQKIDAYLFYLDTQEVVPLPAQF